MHNCTLYHMIFFVYVVNSGYIYMIMIADILAV